MVRAMNTSRTLNYGGCALSYRVWGDGPPVVFIQGTGVQGDGWQTQTSELSSGYRCLTFDNRGMGLSQPPDPQLSVDQMAADVQALMDAEGWHSAHIVGHSLGGLIALNFALNHRDRILSLALLCTFADGKVPVRLSGQVIWVGLRIMVGSRAQRRSAFLEMVMPAGILARSNRAELAVTYAQTFGHDLADQPPVVRGQLAAMRGYDATPRLDELAGVRTLVVSASEDMLAPPWAGRALAEGIPGARFVEIPNAAHALPVHSPGLVNALLKEHLSPEAGRAS